MQTGTLIIGGGLCGLSLAHALALAKQDFLLVEARPRFGGRILTKRLAGASVDLGPAWFWPGQPRIAELVRAHGLQVFEQYSAGALLYEDGQTAIQRLDGYAPMAGSLRIDGGFGALIDVLVGSLLSEKLHLSTPIAEIRQVGTGVVATTDQGLHIEAERAVLALPPRLGATLHYDPALPKTVTDRFAKTPTWMAGQAKALAIFEQPFWRAAGLSGDAMSRIGPLAEIHDASSANGGVSALFGFVGVPVQARSDRYSLQRQIQDQLVRLFGNEAASPTDLIIEDWAAAPFTATDLDQQPLVSHPEYGLPKSLTGQWNGKLLFSGTETAPHFGGFLEGALEAAEVTLDMLKAFQRHRT